MWSRSQSNSTLRSRPRAFNERSVSARICSGRLVLSPTKVELWSWNQRITSSTPGWGGSVPGTCSGDEGCPRYQSRTSRRTIAPTDEEAFEVPGIHVYLGHLDAAEVIRPVHPVVVEESAADHVPLVEDRAVDLEHDQQSVCR